MVERVAFLVEETGERISALLNPSSVRVRRQSGLRVLTDRPGTIGGLGGSDDILIHTSGGRTEIELELLFDVSLVPADPTTPVLDVRQLTGPLWRLSENRPGSKGVPALRMVWGTRWNVSAVVDAVSERLEEFTADGAPTRSMLSMRLVRTQEELIETAVTSTDIMLDPTLSVTEPSSMHVTPRAPLAELPGSTFHEVLGGEDGEGERLETIAANHYGNPGYWRHLAAINGIVDSLPWVRPGLMLTLPSIEVLSGLVPDDVVTEVIETTEVIEP